MMSPLALLLLAIALALAIGSVGSASAAFQSDELDDEEFGLVGSSPPSPPASSSQSEPVRKKAVDPPASPPESSKVQFPLEHAFGGSEFTRAGVFTARLRPSFRGGQTLVKLRLSRLPLSESQMREFEDVLKDDGFYTIRVPANPLNPGTEFVVSSMKARCLALANFRERFDIYTDQGNIISVNYNAGTECPYPRELKKPAKWTFDSHIVSKGGDQAKTVFVNDLGLGSSDVLGDEVLATKKPPEKSFWAKYWMYMIPLGLIVMNAFTQIANMQEEPAGTQAGGQQARAPATVRRR